MSTPARKPMSGWVLGGIVVGGTILVLGVLAVGLFALNIHSTTSTSASTSAAGEEVRYEVTTDGLATTVDLTWSTPTGISQDQDRAVPLVDDQGGKGLTYRFDPGGFVSVTAQISDPDYSDTITCRIVTTSGTVLATNTATGFPAIATCKGTAP